MLFLIEYDRHEGKLVRIKTFENGENNTAEGVRLDLELELNRKGSEHEVVLLEAPSEDALRLTHRRYFENLSELVRAS